MARNGTITPPTPVQVQGTLPILAQGFNRLTTPDGKTSTDLLAEVQTEQFVYDSAADEGYRIAASNIENEVAQMMVGSWRAIFLCC